MKITPMGARVLIKPRKTEEKTAGGIYIPETAKEGKKEGTVVAVGNDKEGKVLPLKEGDRIMYGGYSSEEFEVDDEKFIIVEFKDVIAKLEE